MQHITVTEQVSLGNNDHLNRKLKLRISFIHSVLEILDNTRIKAEVVLIAETTGPAGMVSFQFNCADPSFEDVLAESLDVFRGAL
jgi:hypothetical protein